MQGNSKMFDSFKYKIMANEQIISITDKSLKALSKPNVSSKKTIQRMTTDWQWDQDFTKFFHHKEMIMNNKYRLQLLPLNQQFYVINMQDYLFPVQLTVQGVKNNGVIHIGYDKQYPGHGQLVMRSQQSEQLQDQANNTHFYNVKQDMKIILKNNTKKLIREIYIGVKSKNKIFICNLIPKASGDVTPNIRKKTQTTLNKLPEVPLISRPIRKEKIKTQQGVDDWKKSLAEIIGFDSSIKHIKEKKRQNNKQLTGYEFLNEKKNQIKGNTNDISIKQQQDNSLPQLQKKHKTKSVTTIKSKHLTEQKITIAHENILNQIKDKLLFTKQSGNKAQLAQFAKKITFRHRNPSVKEKIGIAQEKKLKLQQLKAKQLEYFQLSNKIKNLIKGYEANLHKEQLKRKKLNSIIVPILCMAKFLKSSQQAHQKKYQEVVRQWKVDYLCMKFSRKMKKQHQKQAKLVVGIGKRTLLTIFDLTKFSVKSIHNQSVNKSGRFALKLFNSIIPSIKLNEAFNEAEKYRQKVVKIQRLWSSIYWNRLKMLKILIEKFLQKLLIQFPHFSKVLGDFHANNIPSKLSKQYLYDECMKTRQIYQAYRIALHQRQQYIQMNKDIMVYNQTHKKQKPKQLLNIPNKPKKVNYYFFKNADILRSSLRGWFEVEYRKWEKKNPMYSF